jgi:hypothetical protein
MDETIIEFAPGTAPSNRWRTEVRMTQSPRKLRLSPVQVLTMGQAASVAVSAVLPMILSRTLPVDDFASFRFATFFLGLVTVVGSLGFDTSMYILVTRAKDRSLSFSRNSLVWGAAAGVLISGLIVLTRHFWPDNIRTLLDAELLPPLGLALIATMMSAHLEHLLVILERHRSAAAISAVSAIGMAIVCMAIVAINGSAQAALWAIAGWHSLRSLLLLVFHLNASRQSTTTPMISFRTQLKHGLPGGASNALMALQRLDRLIVASRFSAGDFALYSVGSFEIPLARNYAESQHQIATVESIARGRTASRPDLQTWLGYVSRSLIVLFPTVLICVFFSDWIIATLFGATYRDAGAYFGLACLSTLLFAADPELLLRSGPYGRPLVAIQVFSSGIFVLSLAIPGLTPLQILCCRIASEFIAVASKYFVLYWSHASFRSDLPQAEPPADSIVTI